MTYVRGQERMLYQQVFDHLQTCMLVDLEWNGGTIGHLPYGAASALRFEELIPDPKLTAVEPNLVGFSEGRMPTETDEEMGAQWTGGLVSTTHTFFVDIYGEKQSIAKAIASDVRAIFSGRLTFSPVIYMRDYRDYNKPILPGHLIRFEDVEIDFPAVGSSSKIHWAVVKVTAVHEYAV